MKKIKLLLLFLFLFILGTTSVFASNKINKISMDIYVDNEGTAHITEVWDAKLTEGTEGYHPYYNLGNSKITNFTVSDDRGQKYEFVSSWNIKNSFDKKKNTNGIYVDGKEVDLCWGISEYGKRVYTLKYDIENYIYNTTDGYQILFWQLIPYDMKPKPNDVYIKIHSDKRYEDSLDVWGYGNYGGTAYVYDGYIEMQPPKNGLKSSDYMTILVKFPKDYFNTTNKINKTWDQVFEGAEEGTKKYDKKKEDALAVIFGLLSVFGPTILIIVLAIIFGNSSNSSDKIKNKIYPKKDVLPFRDLPFKDDFLMAYYISSEYRLIKKKTDLLGAILLKWIKEDKVNVTTEEKGIFKNKNTKIELKEEPTDVTELKMFNMMKTAAKDNILETNEFKKYCSNNYSKVLNWFDNVNIAKYKDICEDSNYIETTTTKGFLGSEKKIAGATVQLNEKGSQLAGLKKFFKEFTTLHEKEAIEVKMWRDYLIYAQIFGMAKEVAKEFKDLYPDVITDDTYTSIILIHDFSTTGVNAASVARSRATSYSSGGGGFSSGGGGGGSFGGGGGGGGFR